jgi:3-dehydroquinate synthase
MNAVSVELGEESYPIYIESGALEQLGQIYTQHDLGARAAVITDRTVEKLYARRALALLKEAKVDVQVIPVPPGEPSKSLEWADRLYTRLIWGGFDRDSVIVAVGGGVVGDLAGFVAATYLRGIPWAAVPTTLLAQVDAAIGGKTGINHRLGKNLIGAFHQPRFVLIDPDMLETLPERERWAGLAEVIKYGLIRDVRLFERLETSLEALARLHDRALLSDVIACSAAIKAEIVSQDEREAGGRAHLNFGHTLGHALEAATKYRRFTHGEAVAWGMLFEASISRARGWLSDGGFSRIATLLARFPCPELPSDLEIESLFPYIHRDKKARQGRLRMVLLRGLGLAELSEIEEREIQEAWEGILRRM